MIAPNPSAGPRHSFVERSLKIAGHRIHCVETGAGDPILFLHGNPTSSYVWRAVMPGVARATGRRCIALDLLGFGKSDKPDRLRHTLHLHRDIIAGVVAALGLSNIVLVAEDWGGPLGMHHLVHEPQLYRAAILMETFLWTFTFADDFHPKFRLPFRLMRGPAGYFMVQVFNLMVKKLIPEHCPITEEGIRYYMDSMPTIRSRRAMLELVRLNPLHGRPRESVRFIEEIRARLPGLRLPVTWLMPSPGVIVSEDYPPSQAKFERFKALLPGLQVKPFGPGHHFLAEENPHRVAQLVSETIREKGLAAV
ncbi:alpha/beta fold hydrolase [Nitratireductor pacificus]|uniref:Haloalkane dehalogenase n=1 Tax=Nitratireductor pacificus pht-3B TaxID=391937 RepID=K2LNQ1_9HYPH|nr:alpha/beta fold hydrolase [Nitratireductor pacificus]EKF19394.1 haloalkane dehalogenase [Nitratireductor pacificus pht-3B]